MGAEALSAARSRAGGALVPGTGDRSGARRNRLGGTCLGARHQGRPGV